MTAHATNGRILIVDDHPADRRYLREILKKADYDIIEAVDGSGALEMAAELLPDLLLVDVSMPGMTGDQVCKTLCEDPETRAIPVIMISGLADVEDRIRALEAGATEYLVKPVDPGELRLRIRNLLRQRQSQRELEAKLRESQQRERRQDAWTTYIFTELDDHLHRLASEADASLDGLEEARQLTSAITGCRELSQSNRAHAITNCDLVALVAELESSLKANLDFHGLDGVVQADIDLLSRVVRHLVRMAQNLSSSNEDHPVEVRSTHSRDGKLKVEIICRGTGIWHDSFEKLNRSSVATQTLDCKTRQELYLSFCKHALDVMGGHIGVDADTDKGLRFWFSLPQQMAPLPLNVIAFNATALSEPDYGDAVSR